MHARWHLGVPPAAPVRHGARPALRTAAAAAAAALAATATALAAVALAAVALAAPLSTAAAA